MTERLNEIIDFISKIENVKILNPFYQNEEGYIQGAIRIRVENNAEELEFEVMISPLYPFQFHGTETIKFINKDLINYNHIMGDGAICIHTSHSPNLKKKLEYDFNSLKSWIYKYYINKDEDVHYEHLIVPSESNNDIYSVFLFNEVDFHFKEKQFGHIAFSKIKNGSYYTKRIETYIIQNFRDKDGDVLVDVNWNLKLKRLKKNLGLFLFIKDAPVEYKKFAFGKWGNLKPYLTIDFLNFLHEFESNFKKMYTGTSVPLLIGYNIPDNEIHWQVINLTMGNFPLYGEKVDKKWTSAIIEEEEIKWKKAINCSYKYYFGRGGLNEKITQNKILIIGIGAVGSQVATTLTRGGCTKIDLIDYDIKEPENICRSEYVNMGISNKVDDLKNLLYDISPFIEINAEYEYSEELISKLKIFSKDSVKRKLINDIFNKYDLIFDCSADNDLLYLLSLLNIQIPLFNISISNHSKHLVCGVDNNRYEFVQTQFQNVLEYNIEDLYNPIGCWNPTFKASYNDINVLVQYAIKHINLKYLQNRPIKNFVIETDELDGFSIKLKEF